MSRERWDGDLQDSLCKLCWRMVLDSLLAPRVVSGASLVSQPPSHQLWEGMKMPFLDLMTLRRSLGASPVPQWLRICQCRGHSFNPWSGNWDPMWHRATKTVRHNHRTHSLEPALYSKEVTQWEARALQLENSPHPIHNQRKLESSSEDPAQPKINNWINK